MEETEYNFLRFKILKLTGVDLRGYKSQQMQRRLTTLLQRSGHASWPAYFRAIQSDAQAIDRLRDYLTINVSSFFRDPEKYGYLADVVLPGLLGRSSNLRVWSAGCSRGHEPYSLAILLQELRRSALHHVLASDLDQSALSAARAGGPYAQEELAHVPPALLARYFQQRSGQHWLSDPATRRSVSFLEHNLLAEPFVAPDGGRFDLIVCRNVVIYFTSEAKVRLYQNLYSALRPGGVLFIGGTEIISRSADIGFETLSMSFYRRAG